MQLEKPLAMPATPARPSKPTVALLSEFLSRIDVARQTEATYRYGLQALAEFLAGSSAPSRGLEALVVPVSALREDTLSAFRHWLRHTRRVSRRTESTYLAAAARYVEWLDANGQLEGDITSSRMKLVLRNARGRRRVGYKTQPIKDAVPLIVDYYDRQPLPEPDGRRQRRQRLTLLRNRAIVHMLFATGLRAQELASLRRADCADGASDRVLITGKGEKERLVLLDAETQQAIRTYLRARDADASLAHAANARSTGTAAQSAPRRPRPLPGGADPLFVRHDRESAAPITTRTVWHLVSHAARALGLAGGVSPHDFRRFIATTLLSEGMPLESVQAFLGHESIVTTRTVYAHTWSEVLEDQVKTYRPTPAQALKRVRRTG
jgi:site-specific recombinase XerD